MQNNIWEDILGSPKHIVAPMVDASELAWRLLSRRYGAELCYTPMLHSANFVKDAKYRLESLQSCKEDQPLIVQFCGNDPNILLKAALLAQDYCCAIDINLGCPQAIAKRGHYGAFLQDEWPLVEEIVNNLSRKLKVPITCKIRVFDDLQKTIDYAVMLEKAGCSMLTVHGRTRDQKGPLTGLADWNYVRKIRDVLKIPIISNGNIQCLSDIDRCLNSTGAQGVMTAEGNLYNPCIFKHNFTPVSWDIALEYLALVDQYPCPNSYIRGHLFKLFHHLLALPENNQIRIDLGSANMMEHFKRVCFILREKYERLHEGKRIWKDIRNEKEYDLVLPPWICQPYVRIAPEEHLKLVERSQNKIIEDGQNKRVYEDAEGNPISRKSMKKMKRISRRPEKVITENKKFLEKCRNCVNPMGNRCEFKLCKKCCRDKCYIDCLDCPGHRILIKTRRERGDYHFVKVDS